MNDSQQAFENAWMASPRSCDPYAKAEWRAIFREGWDARQKEVDALKARVEEPHTADCGFTVTGHIKNCSCGAEDARRPAPENDEGLEFFAKMVNAKPAEQDGVATQGGQQEGVERSCLTCGKLMPQTLEGDVCCSSPEKCRTDDFLFWQPASKDTQPEGTK